MVIEENRNYVIVPSISYGLVDFSRVLDTSEYLRYSLAETEFIVKYEGKMPSSIDAIEGASSEYSYAEILAEVQRPSWKVEEDEDTLFE